MEHEPKETQKEEMGTLQYVVGCWAFVVAVLVVGAGYIGFFVWVSQFIGGDASVATGMAIFFGSILTAVIIGSYHDTKSGF